MIKKIIDKIVSDVIENVIESEFDRLMDSLGKSLEDPSIARAELVSTQELRLSWPMGLIRDEKGSWIYETKEQSGIRKNIKSSLMTLKSILKTP